MYTPRDAQKQTILTLCPAMSQTSRKALVRAYCMFTIHPFILSMAGRLYIYLKKIKIDIIVRFDILQSNRTAFHAYQKHPDSSCELKSPVKSHGL